MISLRKLERYHGDGIYDALTGHPPDPCGLFHEGRGRRWHKATRWAYEHGYATGLAMKGERDDAHHQRSTHQVPPQQP